MKNLDLEWLAVTGLVGVGLFGLGIGTRNKKFETELEKLETKLAGIEFRTREWRRAVGSDFANIGDELKDLEARLRKLEEG